MTVDRQVTTALGNSPVCRTVRFECPQCDFLIGFWILPPKEKNNLYYNLCSQNMRQNIETLITQSHTPQEPALCSSSTAHVRHTPLLSQNQGENQGENRPQNTTIGIQMSDGYWTIISEGTPINENIVTIQHEIL